MSRVVIVTGGLGALGRAVIDKLALLGWTVAAVDLAPSVSLADTALVLGGVDLADSPSVGAAYSTVVEQLGKIDAIVNLAGGFVWEPVEQGNIDNWDNMYRVNLRTAAVSAQSAIPYLSVAGCSIVNVGAAVAERPGKGLAAYAAAKAGVRALTESLAEELRERRVRVNAILPTIIDTPANRREMPDADRADWLKPERIADVVAFLISEQASTITGAAIPLSVGG